MLVWLHVTVVEFFLCIKISITFQETVGILSQAQAEAAVDKTLKVKKVSGKKSAPTTTADSPEGDLALLLNNVQKKRQPSGTFIHYAHTYVFLFR